MHLEKRRVEAILARVFEFRGYRLHERSQSFVHPEVKSDK
jgi:hypothetical protein